MSLCVLTIICFIITVRANPEDRCPSHKPAASILVDFSLCTYVRIPVDPGVCVCLICISTMGRLSKEALPIYTPIGHVWGIRSSSFLPLIGITQLSSFCQSKGVKCYLVLICISLTANEFEHHFMCLLALGVSFSVNCLSYHLPIFLLDLMPS